MTADSAVLDASPTADAIDRLWFLLMADENFTLGLRMAARPGRAMSPVLVVLRIGFIVVAVEGLIMLLVHAQGPAAHMLGIHSEWGLAALDAAALVTISSPIIYFWVIRPYISARNDAEARLRQHKHALQERVAELEEAQSRLERQGADLIRLAENLRIARDAADIANRAKSEFLATMSHELRTPLNAVIGFSEIMISETFGPVGSVKYRGYAEDIHASGHHLLDLINDILDLAKVESGSDELNEEDIAVPTVAESVLRLVKQRAEKGGVRLELDIPDDPPLLHADKRKLKQILVNLLTNAIKFTDAGGTITLGARCEVDHGYVFQIADSGIGMKPEDIPKALSRFGQVDDDPGRQQEGTGLGLPLTMALAERHGGSLELESELGVGTTATVRFPPRRIVLAPVSRSVDGRDAG